MRTVKLVRKLVAVLAMAAAILTIPALCAHAGERVADLPTSGAYDDHGVCAALKPAPTAIQVELVQAKPLFDSAEPLTNLITNGQYYRKQWLENARLKELWAVNELDTAGVAYGGFDAVYNMDTIKVSVDQYGAYYCVFFKTVNIQLLYSSRVQLPKSIAPDSCAYQVIRTHEQMLLDASKQAVETYVERLRQDMPGIIEQIEIGFASKATMLTRDSVMQSSIREAVEVYLNETLGAKVKQLVQIVNTPEEMSLRQAALDVCKNPPPDTAGKAQ